MLRGTIVVNQRPKTMHSLKVLLMLAFALSSTPAFAQAIALRDYLDAMDRTEVLFSGRIKYDSREDRFTFYDESREPFGVTVDAGRDARERIEANCENSSFIASYSELCSISGSGTVEIRGSRIYISIETVEHVGR